MTTKLRAIIVALFISFGLSFVDIQAETLTIDLLMGFREANSSRQDSKQLELHKKLQATYNKLGDKIGTTFMLRFIENATIADFARSINASDSQGVIWIGHGNETIFSGDLGALFEHLPDANERDLLPVLSAYRNNFRGKFLALMTCYARTITSRHGLKFDSLEFFLTDGLTFPFSNIGSLVKAHEKFLISDDQELPIPPQETIDSEIHFQFTRNGSPLDLLVFLGGKPVGAWINSENFELTLPRSAIKNSKNALEWTFQALDSKQLIQVDPGPDIDAFGTINIEAKELETTVRQWEIYVNPKTKKPYGILQRQYRPVLF